MDYVECIIKDKPDKIGGSADMNADIRKLKKNT